MIRVHETNQDNQSIAFNLDDWDQFDRYAQCVAANRDHMMHTSMRKMLPNRVEFRTIHSHNGNIRISITGELVERHAETYCAFCQLYLDGTAGNGIGPKAFYPYTEAEMKQLV